MINSRARSSSVSGWLQGWRARGTKALGRLDRAAHVLDAGKYRRNRDELGVERLRHQPRQRGLADSRRPPQDHRMRLSPLEREPPRLAPRAAAGLPADPRPPA